MSPRALPTFASRWAAAVRARPDHVFLVYEAPDESTTSWTYRRFDDEVERTAAGLAERGVAHGSSVHLALTNGPAFVAAWLACARLGAWMVPSDPRATAVELAGHLRRTGPVVGICATDRADVYREAAAAVADTVTVEVVAIDESAPHVHDLAGAGPAPAPAAVGPLDRMAVMFTSGTTSAPKGVVLTQANYAFAGDVMAAAAGLAADDRQLVVLPLFHANAQYYSFASAISVGASVALVSAFSASRFLAQAARLGATHASLFAAPMRMILARGNTPVDGLALRHCWYAQNITDAQYDEVAALLGCRPRQLYGMTETLPAVLTNRTVDPVPAAMGEVTLGCHVDVLDDHGRPAPAGQVGDLVVGGWPGATIFAGYLDDPDTTVRAVVSRSDDGFVWFRTGDRAGVDADGRFTFAGRTGDVLKVSGENVSTVEVEAALAEHPHVLEAAVVGEPDPVRDEVPVAYVVARPDAPADALDDLAQWCADRLAPAKRPRAIHSVAELPRTSVGKIRKFLLTRPDPAREVSP